MKIVWIFVIAIMMSFPLFAQTEEIVVYGEIFEIPVKEDYEDLKTDFLRAMKAYLEESVDYEELQKEFDHYQAATDDIQAEKDSLIKKKNELLEVRDRRISTLESQLNPTFSFIPSVGYSYSEEGHGVSIGVGALVFNSFFIEIQGAYPWRVGLSLGWRI